MRGLFLSMKKIIFVFLAVFFSSCFQLESDIKGKWKARKFVTNVDANQIPEHLRMEVEKNIKSIEIFLGENGRGYYIDNLYSAEMEWEYDKAGQKLNMYDYVNRVHFSFKVLSLQDNTLVLDEGNVYSRFRMSIYFDRVE